MKDNDSRIKQIIEQQVRKILAEAEPDKTPKSDDKGKEKSGKITRGPVGRGRIKNKISEVGALAANEPEKLMDRLQVKSGAGNTIQERVLSVLRSAIYGTATMRDAFMGAALREEKVYVSPREISSRDGVMYIVHILTAADKTDKLGTYDNEIVVSDDEGIVIEFK